MKIKFISFFVFTSVTIACQQTGKKNETALQEYKPYTIDLSEIEYSEKPQLLSDFVESIEYIKLSDEPLLPDICNVHLVEDSAGYLYIDYIDEICKYTPKGMFIKPLFKKGQGPGEIYQKNTPAVYNLEDNYVVVKNYGAGYNKYTLDGEFIEHFTDWSDDHKQVLDILAYWKNGEMFYYEENERPKIHEKVNTDGPYFFSVRDVTKDSTIYKLPNHHFDIKAEASGFTIHIPCKPAYRGNIDDSIFWMKPLSVDTVYCTSDWTDVHPLYIIKNSSTAADYAWSVRANVANLTHDEFYKQRLGDVWALKSGLLFSYIHDKEKIGVGFCPADGKAKTYSKLFKNDVDKYCPAIDFEEKLGAGTLFQKNGYLYLLIEADKFFEEGAQPPFPDLTEDSNPVVVKLKLK